MLFKKSLLADLPRVNWHAAALGSGGIAVVQNARHHDTRPLPRRQEADRQRTAFCLLLASPHKSPHTFDRSLPGTIAVADIPDSFRRRNLPAYHRPFRNALDRGHLAMTPLGWPAVLPIHGHRPQPFCGRLQQRLSIAQNADTAGWLLHIDD